MQAFASGNGKYRYTGRLDMLNGPAFHLLPSSYSPETVEDDPWRLILVMVAKWTRVRRAQVP